MRLAVLLFDGFTTPDVIGGDEVLSRILGMEVNFDQVGWFTTATQVACHTTATQVACHTTATQVACHTMATQVAHHMTATQVAFAPIGLPSCSARGRRVV